MPQLINRHVSPLTSTCIDRSKCERVVPMQVLVLGLCRTGTTSIKVALKELGYEDVYHILRHRAVTDFPCAAFAPELIAAYPNAKVILTNRDIDSWYQSTTETVMGVSGTTFELFLSFFSWDASRMYSLLTMLWDRFYDGDFRKNGKRIFSQHYEQVRYIMSDRPQDLLEFEVKQGWAPLCHFLDKQIPKQEFPYTNDRRTFQSKMRSREKGAIARIAITILPMLVVFGGILWALKTRY